MLLICWNRSYSRLYWKWCSEQYVFLLHHRQWTYLQFRWCQRWVESIIMNYIIMISPWMGHRYDLSKCVRGLICVDPPLYGLLCGTCYCHKLKCVKQNNQWVLYRVLSCESWAISQVKSLTSWITTHNEKWINLLKERNSPNFEN